MTVIAALELDDLVPSGKAPCSTNRTHHCLSTGIYHAHHFHTGNDLVNEFCHFHFQRCSSAVAETVFQLAAYCLQHHVRVMPQDHRTPGTNIINISVAVLVVEVLIFGTLDKSRRSAHGLKCTYRRIDAAGHQFFGTGVEFLRMCDLHLFHYPILPSRIYCASSIAK